MSCDNEGELIACPSQYRIRLAGTSCKGFVQRNMRCIHPMEQNVIAYREIYERRLLFQLSLGISFQYSDSRSPEVLNTLFSFGNPIPTLQVFPTFVKKACLHGGIEYQGDGIDWRCVKKLKVFTPSRSFVKE